MSVFWFWISVHQANQRPTKSFESVLGRRKSGKGKISKNVCRLMDQRASGKSASYKVFEPLGVRPTHLTINLQGILTGHGKGICRFFVLSSWFLVRVECVVRIPSYPCKQVSRNFSHVVNQKPGLSQRTQRKALLKFKNTLESLRFSLCPLRALA